MRTAGLALAGLAAAAVAVGCALAVAPGAAPGPVAITAEPVAIAPAELHGLKLRSAVVLTADNPGFGGFSGLQIGDGRMTAVTDEGWLLRAQLADGPDGLRPTAGRLAPLALAGGVPEDKAAGDSESLTSIGDGLAIGFERDHRIELLEDGRPPRELRDRAWERLASNNGLEALATLPDGRLIAIAEAPAAGGFPDFVIGPDGSIAEGRMPQVGRQYVTGADLGPDGLLYVLRRDFSLLAGLSIRIERWRLGPDGFPVPGTREELAAFESESGIDNMEAIALWRDAGGRTRLTIVSDDNFNAIQRTLLMDFEVLR